MATQLATLFLRRLEVPLVITDVDAERVEEAVAAIRADLEKQASRGRLSEGKARFLGSIVSGVADTSAFAGCDLVIEAVFEEIAVKREVFGALESVVSEECLLVTNTSSLSVAEMAAELQHPGARRRDALLQPGRRAPARRARARSGHRRRDARDRLGRDEEARQARRARPRCAGVRRQPAADAPVVRADAGARERQHVRGDGRGGAPARAADAAVGPARDGRAEGREPRPPHAPRRVSRTASRSRRRSRTSPTARWTSCSPATPGRPRTRSTTDPDGARRRGPAPARRGCRRRPRARSTPA